MTKNAPRDAHLREEETCRKRPRSARECAKAHSFLLVFLMLTLCGVMQYNGTQKNGGREDVRYVKP